MLAPMLCIVLTVVTACHIKLCPFLTDTWYLKMTPRKRQRLCLARPCPQHKLWTDEKPAMMLVDGGEVIFWGSDYMRPVMGKVGAEHLPFRRMSVYLTA